MPEQHDSKSSGLPWPALLTLAIAGTAAIYYSSLKSDRPEVQFTGSPPALGDQRFAARAWQDPFKAAEAWVAREDKARGQSVWQKSLWLKMPDEPRVRALSEQIKDPDGNNDPGQTLVLAVMLPAGPSAELAEQRLRARLAVIEGLLRCGYEANDGDHIGLQPMLWGKDRVLSEGVRLAKDRKSVFLPADPRGDEGCQPFPVPFEWYRQTHIPISAYPSDKPPSAQSVLVVWLPEELMTDRPITRLTDCLDAIGALPAQGAEVKAKDHPQVCVIGPRVSPTLRNMVKEALESPAQKQWSARGALSGVRILSPTALAADDMLLNFDRKVDGKNWAGWKVNAANSIARSIDMCCGAKFIRSTTTEDDFCREAWDELKLRHRAEPYSSAHIAIVAESDTFYGRAVTGTFIAHGSSPVERGRVDCFAYVRGVDGQAVDQGTGPIPESKAGEQASSPHMPGTKTKGPAESPNGTNQSDYIRRLADKIVERDTEYRRVDPREGIVAVGVFGTDVYDKMLILQALRDRLSDPLFFTTGVDAQYAMSSEWPAAHNLVCISPFGLSLDPDHQGPFPPFRDSNQTAVYTSTILAVYPDLGEMSALLGSPRRFEVSRTGLADLSVSRPGEHNWHPARADFPVHKITRPWVLLLMAGVLAVMLFLVFACGIRPLDSRLRRMLPWSPFISAAVAAFILTFLLPPYIFPDSGEPFVWFEGISIWPTEIIRLLAAGMAGLFIWRSVTEGIDNERQIEEQFRFCNLANAPYVSGTRYSRAERVVTGIVGTARGIWQPAATAIQWMKEWAPGSLRKSYAGDKRFCKPVVKAARIHKNNPQADASDFMPLEVCEMDWSFALKNWRVLGKAALMATEHPKPLDEGNASHFLGTVGGEVESAVRVYAQNLWWEYLRRSQLGIRAFRVLAFALLYLGFFVLLIVFWTGLPQVPARGTYAFAVDKFALFISVLASTLLTWLVLDSAYLSRRFIQCLARTDTHWPAETIESFQIGCDRELISEYLDIRLIAARTRVVGELIYYPFVIFFLLVVARTSLFANWTWPVGLTVVMCSNLGLAIIAALMLRMTAEDARRVAITKIERRRIQMVSEPKPESAKTLEEFAAAIRAERDGAFSILSRHPMLAAILLPSGSVGAWAILEYIARSTG